MRRSTAQTGRCGEMTPNLNAFAMVGALIAFMLGEPAFAQKSGGTLTVHQFDNPPSLSIHEEVTYATDVPMMGLFNNLVMYKQDEPRNSLQSIVPDLATSWSWSEDGIRLTFELREGVKWHDGKPFTPNDVRCTWDMLLGRSTEKLHQPPQELVPKPRRGHGRRRFYCNISSEASATGADRPSRFGILAGLSLPRSATRDAAASCRHRPV
jgi:ABC-type transport system substrate-binding protein